MNPQQADKPVQSSKESTNQEPRLPVLILTSLYPHPGRPGRAAFNRQQFEALGRRARLALVSPLPFRELPALFRPRPGYHPPGFPVSRPLFWYLPGLGRRWLGPAYLLSARARVRRWAGALRPRVMLATWLYPDAWAGLHLARELGLPLVVKLHGSDLMVLKDDPARRPFLGQTLAGAAAVVAVSRSLARQAISLGADPERTFIVGNGLDREIFHPADQGQARRELGLEQSGRVLVMVGNLVPVKGPELALEALARLPGVELLVVGDGPLAGRLREQARRLGLAGRVRWLGRLPHRQVARCLAAADALVLPSLSEGEPNVVLEALACGRPVAASAVGGVAELVHEGKNGVLFPPGRVAELAAALERVLARSWDPDQIAASVADRSWDESAARLLAVLERAAGEKA